MSSFDSTHWPGVADLPEGPPDTLAPPAEPAPAGGHPWTSPPPSAAPWLQPLPPGPPAPPPPDRRRAWIATAAIGAVVVLIVAAVLGYRLGRPDGDTATPAVPAAPSTTTGPDTSASPPGSLGAPSTTAPAAPTTQSPPVTTADAELDAALQDIEHFVERQRGLQFTQPVKAQELDDAAFTQKLLSTETEEDRQQARKSGDQLKALGMIPADLDFVATIHQSLATGVVGFYDPETKELYVRGGDLGPYQRTTLAHELTHALEDQHFDLLRKQYDTDKGELSFGFSSLAEGSATRVQHAYFSQLSTADKRDYQKAESLIGNNGELDGVPPVVLQFQAAPYQLGEPLVGDIIDHGGQAALDQAFADPPTTSEQVIDPTKYLDREPAIKVDPPPADGPVEIDGAVGELATDLLLQPVVGDRAALQAATGWGGDWSVLYDSGGQKCIRIDYVMDTPTDLQELQRAFQQWAAAGSSRTLEGLGPTKFRVTSCIPQ